MKKLPRKQILNQKWNPSDSTEIPLICINYFCKFYENGHVPQKTGNVIEYGLLPLLQIRPIIHQKLEKYRRDERND